MNHGVSPFIFVLYEFFFMSLIMLNLVLFFIRRSWSRQQVDCLLHTFQPVTVYFGWFARYTRGIFEAVISAIKFPLGFVCEKMLLIAVLFAYVHNT